MYSKIFKISLCLMLITVSFSSQAQKWDAGVMLGINGYQGDLDKFTIPEAKYAHPAFGLFLRRNFEKNFSLRGNLAFAKLSADDQNYAARASRNFSFSSPLTEASLQGEFQLVREKKKRDDVQIQTNARSKKAIVPYIIVGAGLAFTKPVVNFNETTTTADKAAIQKDKNANYSGTNFVLPMGGGFRMNLSNRMAFGAEIAVRPTFGDYIDGVSQSANPKANDWYATGLLTLSRTFGEPDEDNDGVVDSKDQCPSVKGLVTLSGCPDADSDGVSDGLDACPNEIGKKNLHGCPDTDNDGVADKEDDCPDVAGLIEFKGCPDTDKDGVPDKLDKCPKEPGDPKHDGCVFIDRDNDGIADAEDKCPDLPGENRYKGCPDTDKDGISDDLDDCPTKYGPLNFVGCPDSDGDGISDPKDDCPSIAGSLANKGCPTISKPTEIVTKVETPTPVKTKILETSEGFIKKVYFTTSKALLEGSNLRTMEEVLGYLNAHPDYDLKVGGHTDNTGANPSNMTLSESRAKMCYDWFKGRGVNSKRMSFNGYAAEQPDAPNTTESGRALNRRVEFEVYRRK